ncbi:hypothetical protein VA7868_04212 [Vibrio aerogenes CECT 7868]|uniref:Uncharacterized protein n=1 Tax=Vibrio aerogenes CECT 7868 TaxID=1216006 RepID=A0A1M6DEN8_9VIBR|nr:hypothetical protein [Vibrio aerogenes]SHI71764.1 hypothetical protein VA7868_04212 [Vibrio aerogenes CECT 7868]
MTLLEQAQALLEGPVTLQTLNDLETLSEQASGEEKEQIGDLIETAIISAPLDVIEQYQASLS